MKLRIKGPTSNGLKTICVPTPSFQSQQVFCFWFVVPVTLSGSLPFCLLILLDCTRPISKRQVKQNECSVPQYFPHQSFPEKKSIKGERRKMSLLIHNHVTRQDVWKQRNPFCFEQVFGERVKNIIEQLSTLFLFGRHPKAAHTNKKYLICNKR